MESAFYYIFLNYCCTFTIQGLNQKHFKKIAIDKIQEKTKPLKFVEGHIYIKEGYEIKEFLQAF